MTHEGTTYRLLEGRGILVEHCGEPLRLGSVSGCRDQGAVPMSAPEYGEKLAS